MWSVVTTSAPATEPITLAEAKLHLRVDSSDDDDLITAQISAAREYVEAATGRALVQRTVALRLDAFPAGDIVLPLGRAVSVSSIGYIDTAGAAQTLAGGLYSADVNAQPARIAPAYGESWPSTRAQTAAVTVTFVAGYGAAAAVPAAAVVAIKLLVAHWYESREAVVVGTISGPLPMAVDALCAALRLRDQR